jgi:hypothetical protein
MEVSISIMFILSGFFIGYLFKLWSDKLSDKVKTLKEVKDKNEQYKRAYQNIINKKSRFKTRVNNTVYVSTKLPDYGKVDIVYLMDKNDIAIFKEDKCIMTSDMVSDDTIKDIITSINERHGYRISDIVEILGFVFYRPEFEKTFNVDFNEIKERSMRIAKQMDDSESDIDKIYNENKTKFDIDEILDKISKVGMKNLTPSEIEFLNNYNK